MSSSASRPARGYTQDYIARIRYSNALPPPAMPPKLLEIPAPGLSHYLSASWAGRLAREYPINIEADAELGMPLDLVGVPGIFDGDESAILAPEHPPTPDPRDKALLRPLSVRGKEKAPAVNVSFLRRSEHMTPDQKAARAEAAAAKARSRTPSNPLKKPDSPEAVPDDGREDPAHILKTVIKGFDLANPESVYDGPNTADNVRGYEPTPAERDAWSHPQHPTKKNLQLVDSFPVLPDLEAYPDTGGYILIKFATYPVAVTDRYDERLDYGLLRPLDLRPELAASQEAASAAHAADPSKPAPGPPPYDYEYFVPSDPYSLDNIRDKFNLNNPQRDDPDLYTTESKASGERCFRFDRVRAYETVTTSGAVAKKFDEVALTLYEPDPPPATDGDDDGAPPPARRTKKQKAAYVYPILQKAQIRPRRNTVVRHNLMTGGSAPGGDGEEQDVVHHLEIVIRDPDETEQTRRGQHQSEYDPALKVEEPEDGAAAAAASTV